jgi:hypothetical protein
MKLDSDIGARSAKAILFDGDDHGVAGAGPSGETRGASANAVWRRARRVETLQPDAAHAAPFAEGCARLRRLAPLAKEISQ